MENVKEIYNAIIGSSDGKEKHTLVDYDEVSYFYAHSRGIKTSDNLYLEIRDSVYYENFNKYQYPVFNYFITFTETIKYVKQEISCWNNLRNRLHGWR